MNKISNNMNASNSPSGAGGNRIIIAGGGTGGHIFPAIAIANALKQLQPAAEILFIGAAGKMEMEKVPQAGYNIEGLDIAGFNRTELLKNISLPFKLVKSFFQVREIFKKFQPDAVVGVGGYSSFPVLRYAQAKGIPSFIHEANSFAGKSNIMLGKGATKIFVATHGMQQFFPNEKIIVSGNPVRKNIVDSNISREAAIRSFGLNENKMTVLAVGGSLGAKSINEAIASHIDAFDLNELQLIWQTGKTTADQYKKIAADRKNIYANEFITEMDKAYAAADIVISRAGAMSVAEICVVKKPAIFVPFPFAAEDHQTVNAKHLVDRKAALMIKDNEAKEKLVSMVVSLAKEKPLQEELKINVAAFAITNADEIVAKQILQIIA
jgi:UDP-N-acetylglucosamine--N-acetylmuramyl-(pentapeptide) pyrophosphoryl-undecaprenol N-acetylglucosamine transferase